MAQAFGTTTAKPRCNRGKERIYNEDQGDSLPPHKLPAASQPVSNIFRLVDGLGIEPHASRKLEAAEVLEKRRIKKREARSEKRGHVTVRNKKGQKSGAAVLARVRTELAKPQLTKSVRETATKKQLAAWNAGY
ncbi:MAG TPA: hypothetical protein VKP61_02165 [Candidatus Acidoferrum sp.]|nr:hypothetical protein [Candidatus Acidoferrum sp.]